MSDAMRRLAVLAALFVAYVATARFGLSLASVNPSVTPVWPPTGIAIAAVLLIGRPAWWPTFLAAFLVNVSTTGSILTSIGIAFGNTLEAIVGAYAIALWADGRNALERARTIYRFAVLMAPT